MSEQNTTTPATPSAKASLSVVGNHDAITHLRPKVDEKSLTHRQLRRDFFWQAIPAWKDVTYDTFIDHKWQEKNAITSPEKLIATVRELASKEFIDDITKGFHEAPMAVRISPYLIALMDWTKPYEDPLRRQFLPLSSSLEPDHPMLTLDSLHEQEDAPVPGLTHRYPDKALFLTLDTCPVYCRFCTRSYAVGLNTDIVEKVSIKATEERWAQAFQYIRERVELEDIVISGGDSYRLRADQVRLIGNTLLDIPHVRRMRFATKGPAIQPMKLLTDNDWVNALVEVTERGRSMRKDVVLHTHFNHPNEVTGISEDALGRLFEKGVVVRNQSVLQNGVNDAEDTMIELSRRLSYINVHPYYVYVHDLVKGTEDLRTSVATAVKLEKTLRGCSAGFNTPTFVVDAPGGGGKRDAHSYEWYDRETGISCYTAPSVKKGKVFMYFDPLRTLSSAVQKDWQDPNKQKQMIGDAENLARKHRI